MVSAAADTASSVRSRVTVNVWAVVDASWSTLAVRSSVVASSVTVSSTRSPAASIRPLT